MTPDRGVTRGHRWSWRREQSHAKSGRQPRHYHPPRDLNWSLHALLEGERLVIQCRIKRSREGERLADLRTLELR